METSLKKLFSLGKSSEESLNQSQVPSQEYRQAGETYKQYGFRIAGLTQGSIQSLTPNLQTVYLGIRRDQEQDEVLQQQLITKLKGDKLKKEQDKKLNENQIEASKTRQESIASNLEEKNRNLNELKSNSYERNRSAWITVIISSIILIPFTVYFFIFYSSVAYSAFFKDFDVNSLAADGNFKLSQAIFDGGAIPAAYQEGIGELLFILLMPVVFLAFGFVLYKWETEKGWLKYIKIPAIIVVAFIFDSLLSYEICEKLYNLDSLMSINDRPDYDLSLAFHEPRFWVIICLGFVSYLIWGIVFGYLMKAWENLDLNKIKEKELLAAIKNLKEDQDAEKQKVHDLTGQNIALDADIAMIENQMSSAARYDVAKIKQELNNFFAGWQQYLAALGKSDAEKNQAQDEFNKLLQSISLDSIKS